MRQILAQIAIRQGILFPLFFQYRILISVFIYRITIFIIYKGDKLFEQTFSTHPQLFTKFLTGYIVILCKSIDLMFFLHLNSGML